MVPHIAIGIISWFMFYVATTCTTVYYLHYEAVCDGKVKDGGTLNGPRSFPHVTLRCKLQPPKSSISLSFAF